MRFGPGKTFFFHLRKQRGRGLVKAGALRGKVEEEDEERAANQQLYGYKLHPCRWRNVALHGGDSRGQPAAPSLSE